MKFGHVQHEMLPIVTQHSEVMPRGTPFGIFHYTCDQRIFSQGITLGVGGISCALLCSNSIIIAFVGIL